MGRRSLCSVRHSLTLRTPVRVEHTLRLPAGLGIFFRATGRGCRPLRLDRPVLRPILKPARAFGHSANPRARALRWACGLHRTAGSLGDPGWKEDPRQAWSSHYAAQPSRSSNGRPAPMRRRSRPGKSRLKVVGEDRSDGARSSRPSARHAPARTGPRPPCPTFTTGILSVRANTTMAGALPGDRDRRRRGCVCRREQEPPACSTGASDGRHGQSSARGACRHRAAPRRDAAAGAHRWMDRRRRGSRSPRSMDRAALRSHVHALRSGPRAPDPARGIE